MDHFGVALSFSLFLLMDWGKHYSSMPLPFAANNSAKLIGVKSVISIANIYQVLSRDNLSTLSRNTCKKFNIGKKINPHEQGGDTYNIYSHK